MRSVKRFFQNILLVIEVTIYIAYVQFDKVLFVGIIALDQYTKAAISTTMELGETFPIVPKVFHITYVTNPGAAFGILPHQRVFFIFAGVVLLIFAALYYARLRTMNSVMKYGGMSAAAGAVANMIDRVRNGFVVDFIDFRGWPVFNIADIAIVIGMIAMMYVVLFKSAKSSNVGEVRQP